MNITTVMITDATGMIGFISNKMSSIPTINKEDNITNSSKNIVIHDIDTYSAEINDITIKIVLVI